MKLRYEIKEVRPYINWLYFFHTWNMNGKPEEERAKLKADANEVLDGWEGKYHTHGLFEILDANSDNEDLIIGGTRIPMLRQQRPAVAGAPNLCMADFIRPLSSGIKDKAGVFATTVDASLEHINRDDVFMRMMSQVLADRLAEATAEYMHMQIRKIYWGYAPDEDLTAQELFDEKYQGIRPAVGYPSLPDTSMNFLLDALLDFRQIGIRLTENGMMNPHASVSGFIFSHPQSRYFDLGKIGEDQLQDYARRRGIPVELARKFLSAHLVKR